MVVADRGRGFVQVVTADIADAGMDTLDAGFRPGMGGVVPDRFFWALPPGEEPPEGLPTEETVDLIDEPVPSLHSRNVH